MADLSKLRFNGTDYNVKDASAPTRKFNNAYSKTGNLPISSDDTTQTAIGKLENNIIPKSAKGTANGVAELDANGKVPSSQLPSYVDDVLEYSAKSSFPATGESGKIYVDTTTNKTYRWSGSAYVEISESLALGETDSTAYRGDRGKAAYDHSQLTSGNPHNVTKSDVGLGNVGNFKAVSTAASQGLSNTEKANARSNIGAGTGNGTYSKPTGGIPKSDLASAVQTTLDQVATNQTNILYGTRTGAQNLLVCNDIEKLKRLNNTSGSWEGNVFKDGNGTFTINDDGSITVNGTFTVQTFLYLENDNIISASRFKDLATVRLFGCATGGSESSFFLAYRRVSPGYYWFDVGSGVDIGTISASEKVMIFIGVRANVTMSNKTFYPALVLKSIYNQDPNFCPGALPNYDLTYLQAEDRAALAEEIDAGAKNKINIIAGASTTIGNITFTVNSDRSVTVNGTANNSDTFFYLNAANGTSSPVTFTVGSLCILNGCPSGGAQNTYELQFSSQLGDFRDRGSGVEVPANATGSVVIAIRSGYAPSNLKFYPMLATKAAFGVSPKFVPYCIPIKGVYARDTAVACSTTLTTTGIKFTATEKAAYRITATAIYYNSIPIKLVIKYKTNSSATQLPFCTATHADGEDVSLIASGIMGLDAGGEFEIFAQYASPTSNYFYVLVEKIG